MDADGLMPIDEFAFKPIAFPPMLGTASADRLGVCDLRRCLRVRTC
jgi:hypothetical protein